MWRWHVLVVVVVVGFGAGVGWSSAQQTDAERARLSGQDYAEIYQLYSRYAQGTDFREGAMWLSVFTDDAVFQPGADAEEVVGQQALLGRRAEPLRTPGCQGDKTIGLSEPVIQQHGDRFGGAI